MIPNLFDFKRNPISAVLGIILFWALGVQLAYPEITSHFPTGIIDMWEGKSWMIWVQSFFSYDWRQFLMIFMSGFALRGWVRTQDWSLHLFLIGNCLFFWDPPVAKSHHGASRSWS